MFLPPPAFLISFLSSCSLPPPLPLVRVAHRVCSCFPPSRRASEVGGGDGERAVARRVIFLNAVNTRSLLRASANPRSHTNRHYVLTAHSRSHISAHTYSNTHIMPSVSIAHKRAPSNTAEPAFCGCHNTGIATLLSPSLSPRRLSFSILHLISIPCLPPQLLS